MLPNDLKFVYFLRERDSEDENISAIQLRLSNWWKVIARMIQETLSFKISFVSCLSGVQSSDVEGKIVFLTSVSNLKNYNY